MRVWSLAMIVVGLVMAGCGGESYPAGSTSGLTQGSPAQAVSGDPIPTPEPPYLQLNIEPFLLDSNPAEARVGVKASSGNVATILSDLTFMPMTLFVANVGGSPDCEIAEGAADAKFSFLPQGCNGTDCRSVHAVVTTADPNDGYGMLYSCRLTGKGTTAISVDASASSSESVPAEVVTEGQTLSWNGPVELSASASIDPSAYTGEITVSMNAGDNVVAGTQNDLYLDGPGAAFLAGESGKPDCWVNPLLDKVVSVAFRPNSCDGSRCIRAIVQSFSNTDPIATGEWLYRCRIGAIHKVTASFSNCLASTPNGDLVLATGIGATFGE